MYADYTYYTEVYASDVIPETAFPKWSKLASLEIDNMTRGRVAKLDTVPDAVKDCTCAIAEVLYGSDVQEQSYQLQGVAGPLTSWSNDGQSGTVDLGESIYTESGKRKEIRRLCSLYLGLLGLMYAGVIHYES